MTDPSLPVIAVDGTAASGKGTLARALAAHYHMAYLDTGLLYRHVGIEGLRRGVDIDDPDAAGHLAETLAQTVAADTLNDPAYRGDAAGPAASRAAKHGRVRKALMQLQRVFAATPPMLGDGSAAMGAVLDGRDIGTVIAPDANVKFFGDGPDRNTGAAAFQ